MDANPITASELYAMSQGKKCVGHDVCFWCGAPAERNMPHNAPSRVAGQKYLVPCKYPGSSYCCTGCSLFRRPSITIDFLEGGFKDRQCPLNHSWLITDKAAWVIQIESYWKLYETLLKPPTKFCLSLLSSPGKIPNLIQYATVNNFMEVKNDTRLAFTLDGTISSYTVYELEESLKHGGEGKEGGVRQLISLLGPHPKIRQEPEGKKKDERGRPPALPDAKHLKKIITASGM